MKRESVLLALAFFFCGASYAETYKCKSASGQTEISDQPCRTASKTVSVVQKEYISESQRRSSTEWISRGAERMQRQEAEAVATEREAQRQESVRHAAQQQAQQKQQESYERQRLIQEVESLRQQQVATADAANRAAAAANNAANNSGSNRGPTTCRSTGGGWMSCNREFIV